MAIHKLSFDLFENEPYFIVAIHTTLQEYRLAYFINKTLSICLSKNPESVKIKVKEQSFYFARFSYKDLKNEMNWDLIQNKNESKTTNNQKQQNLFFGTTTNLDTVAFLLPEFKKADYFLKIENDDLLFESKKIQSLLSTLEFVSMAYLITPDKIKSKNNLIF